jgi:hypothetical protein
VAPPPTPGERSTTSVEPFASVEALSLVNIGEARRRADHPRPRRRRATSALVLAGR